MKLKSFKRKVIKNAKIEAGWALSLALKFILNQIKTRPRIKLFSKLVIILAIAFISSSQAVAYLKPKEAKIKINGKTILVAQSGEENLEAEFEIDQEVGSRRSPFEFQMPVDGYLSQGYRAYHRAHDIATDFGAPIRPLGPGIVEFAGRVNDGKGNIVVVDHGDGLESLYAHMGEISVGVGNMVNSATTIGTVGLTGRTSGPHVHLEILDAGIAIDPTSILPDKKLN